MFDFLSAFTIQCKRGTIGFVTSAHSSTGLSVQMEQPYSHRTYYRKTLYS